MRKIFASALVQQIEYTLGDKNKELIWSWYDADCESRINVKPFNEYYLSMMVMELPRELYWLIEDSTKTKYCKEREYQHGLNQDEYKAMYDKFGLDMNFEFRYDNRNGANKMVRLKDYLFNVVKNTLESTASVERKIEIIKIEILTLNQQFYQAFSQRVKSFDDFIENPQ